MKKQPIKQVANNQRNQGALSPHEKMMIKTDTRNPTSSGLKQWEINSPEFNQVASHNQKKSSSRHLYNNQDLSNVKSITGSAHNQFTHKNSQQTNLQEKTEETQQQKNNIEKPTSPVRMDDLDVTTYVDVNCVVRAKMMQYDQDGLDKGHINDGESLDLSQEYQGPRDDEEYLDPNQREAQEDYEKVKSEFKSKKLNHYLRQNNDAKAKIDEIVDKFDDLDKIVEYHNRAEVSEKQDFKRDLKNTGPINTVQSENETRQEEYDEMRKSEMGSPILLHEEKLQQPLSVQGANRSMASFGNFQQAVNTPKSQFNQATYQIKNFKDESNQAYTVANSGKGDEKDTEVENLKQVLSQVLEFLCEDCFHKYESLNTDPSPDDKQESRPTTKGQSKPSSINGQRRQSLATMSPTSRGGTASGGTSPNKNIKSYGIKIASNKNMNKRESIIAVMHTSLKQRVDDESKKLKVPLEYQMKFMTGAENESKGGIAEVSEECSSCDHDSLHEDVKAFQKKQKNQNLKQSAQQSEIRVAYLEAELQKMETFYTNMMKESGIKMQVRMRKYAGSCLFQVRKQFKDEMHLIFSEMEMLKNKELELTSKCEMLLKYETQHQQEITEIKSYAHWDEASHQLYTAELEKSGVVPGDLEAITEENQVLKKSFGAKTYYKSILDQGDLEKEIVNLAKPFQLYNGTLELSITERLNVLERETVRLFQKKLAKLEQFGHVGADNEGVGGGSGGGQKGSIVDIMTDDKNRLEKNINDLQDELARLKANWKSDAEQKDAAFTKMQSELTAQIKELKFTAENIKDMFLKELLIKDNIIKSTEGMKDMYLKIAKDLKTKLQIPRLHLEFLKTKGTLEHFVSAKITGDDEAAKWALLQAGKNEIKTIERGNTQRFYEQQKINHRKESYNKYQMMATFSKIANSKRSQTYKDDSNVLEDSKFDSKLDSYHSLDSFESRRKPVTQSSRRNFNHAFMTAGKESKITQRSKSKVFDINFNEMLKSISPRLKGSTRQLPQKFPVQNQSLKNISRAQSNRDMLKKIQFTKPLKSRLSRLDLAAITQHEELKNLTGRSQNIVVQNSTSEIKVGDTINPAPVLDKYLINNPDPSLDESAEFTSHPSDSLNDSSVSRKILKSTLIPDSTAQSKNRVAKPDIQILDQNTINSSKKSILPYSKSQESNKKTTIISKDSSIKLLKVVDEEQSSQKNIANLQQKASLKLSQGNPSPQLSAEISPRHSQGPFKIESVNENMRRMSLHSSENPNPLLDEQFNIQFNNQKIQALNQRLDSTVFVSESPSGGPTMIRHTRVKTFDMAMALNQGSDIHMSIDSQKFSEIKIKSKKDKYDKYTEDIINQIHSQKQCFSNKKQIHSNKQSPTKRHNYYSKQPSTQNQISTISTQKHLKNNRKKDLQDHLSTGGNHLNLLQRVNKNNHKKSIGIQMSYKKPQESQQHKLETEKTETDESQKSYQKNEQQIGLMSKYEQYNSQQLYENGFSEEITIRQGSDTDLPMQESSIHQGGDEVANSTFTKKQIPLKNTGQHQSEHDTMNVTEESIQDTGSFYNKPRMTGEQTEQINPRINYSSEVFLKQNSQMESQKGVPPLLIPTKDLLINNGNYAIARRNRKQPQRKNSDIKEIMTKTKKINQYHSNFQPVIEANEQTPVKFAGKHHLNPINRIGTEMERIENTKFGNTDYFSQNHQFSAPRGLNADFICQDPLIGDINPGEKIAVIRSTEFNLKKASAQAQYNTQDQISGITRNQSVQQKLQTSRFHETQRINNGYFQNNHHASTDGSQIQMMQNPSAKFPVKKGRLLQTSQMTHRVSSKAMIKGQAIMKNQRHQHKNSKVLSQARISQPCNLPEVLSPRDVAFKNQRQSMVFSQGKQAFQHTNITQYPMNVLSSADGKSTHTGGNNEIARKNNQAYKLLENFKSPDSIKEFNEPPITQKEIENMQFQLESTAIENLKAQSSQPKLPNVNQKEIDLAQTRRMGVFLKKPDSLLKQPESLLNANRGKDQSISSFRQTVPLMQDSIQSLVNNSLISEDEFANFSNTKKKTNKQLVSQIYKLKELTSARTGKSSQSKDQI